MKKNINQIRFGLLVAVVLLIVSFVPQHNKNTADNEPANTLVQLKLITNKVQSPVAMGVPRDGTSRLFFCQKEGKVWIVEKGKLLARPFLDVSKRMVKVNPRYDERGLLGSAFHPNFKVNHKFYVYYSAPSTDKNSDNKSILAEYQV
ncbi:MAG: PQQ-dependent sugar dehydrogenase, partial [Ginsengibacter sp.]